MRLSDSDADDDDNDDLEGECDMEAEGERYPGDIMGGETPVSRCQVSVPICSFDLKKMRVLTLRPADTDKIGAILGLAEYSISRTTFDTLGRHSLDR